MKRAIVDFETAIEYKKRGFPQPAACIGQLWYAESDGVLYIATGDCELMRIGSKNYRGAIVEVETLAKFAFAVPTSNGLDADTFELMLSEFDCYSSIKTVGVEGDYLIKSQSGIDEGLVGRRAIVQKLTHPANGIYLARE